VLKDGGGLVRQEEEGVEEKDHGCRRNSLRFSNPASGPPRASPYP